MISEGRRDYQASSPDEVALVKFAEEMKWQLVSRDQHNISLLNPLGAEDAYDILVDFPFSSETKRMGIVVKHRATGRIIFLAKGAEQVIAEKVDPEAASKIKEAAENLSLEGLRTLAFVEKRLTEEMYNTWKAEYDHACAVEVDREKEKLRVRELLEQGMEYVGVTGVEGPSHPPLSRYSTRTCR